jgi:hypothetical protein
MRTGKTTIASTEDGGDVTGVALPWVNLAFTQIPEAS